MALIKCPECGKDVSDTAPSCIHCGFSLAEHYDKLQARNALHKELDKKLHSIENADIPDEPSLFSGEGLWWFIAVLFLGCGAFVCWLHIDLVMSNIGGMPEALVMGLIFIALALLLIRGIIKRYRRSVADYNKKVENWGEYIESEKERTISEYKVYFDNIEKYGNRDGKSESAIQKEDCTVKCPACGSTEVKKISTAKKVISTELWGVGKQRYRKADGL